jgi:hypothetical protein
LARSRYCRVCHEFHDLTEAWPSACYGHFGIRGEEARFYVISDSMDPIVSMATGRPHDSKSAYRKELRALGCYEVGNDRLDRRPVQAPPVRDTLRQVVQQLKG